MRHLAIVPVALLSLATPVFAQRPAPIVVKPTPLSALEPRVDVETVVARLMSFDRNDDGKVAVEELPERMQPLLASAGAPGDRPLDREALRSLAAQARPQTMVRGFSGGGYGFGDVGFPAGDTTSSLIDGAIDDLRLPASARERALAVGRQFVDTMRADAAAGLLATLTSVLSPTQLEAFSTVLSRKSEMHTIDTPDGRHATLVIRPNLEQTLRKFGLTSSQLLQAVPSLLTYEASLRLDDRRRAELLAQLHGILGADDRADLEAALQRRPLVKNVMVLQTNGEADVARLVTQFAAMLATVTTNQAIE